MHIFLTVKKVEIAWKIVKLNKSKKCLWYSHPFTKYYENTRKHWGHVVAQLVEALRYKSDGRGFDPRWCHWNFSLT